MIAVQGTAAEAGLTHKLCCLTLSDKRDISLASVRGADSRATRACPRADASLARLGRRDGFRVVQLLAELAVGLSGAEKIEV
jgi:hypothetical protein